MSILKKIISIFHLKNKWVKLDIEELKKDDYYIPRVFWHNGFVGPLFDMIYKNIYTGTIKIRKRGIT